MNVALIPYYEKPVEEPVKRVRYWGRKQKYPTLVNDPEKRSDLWVGRGKGRRGLAGLLAAAQGRWRRGRGGGDGHEPGLRIGGGSAPAPSAETACGTMIFSGSNSMRCTSPNTK